MSVQPRYPIYIPSKGRAGDCYTARTLSKDRVPFRIVVEPQEHDAYAERFGADRLLVLPYRDKGLFTTRNWIKTHATEEGYDRHWQLDDNIRYFMRVWRGERFHCQAGPAFACVEDFVDRYENVAVAGLDYVMFGTNVTKPFILNCRVYSCTLVLNSIPFRWRLAYNDDTDLCLQVLAGGWCTVLVRVFLAQKVATMMTRGGNTDDRTGPINYQDDGRLRMARALERMWPGVVETRRRFHRPQHVVKDSWKRFDTPLRRKPDVEILDEPNEYGLELRQVRDEIQSSDLRRLLREWREHYGKGHE